MKSKPHYLVHPCEDAVATVVEAIDKDVAHGEDLLMFGFCVVMLSSTFAPIAPPTVVLPLVALTFAISASLARLNYHAMERKLAASIAELEEYERGLVLPIAKVFAARPMPTLAESFNPLKNLTRTWKSALGAILINPLWMPILYVMGMQIMEEKNLIELNKAIIGVEQKLLVSQSSRARRTDAARY